METFLTLVTELKWPVLVGVLAMTLILILRRRILEVKSLKYGDKSVEFGDNREYFENGRFKINIASKVNDEFSVGILAEIKDLTQNISSIHVYENRFKKKLILWRLQALNTKVANIKSETWTVGAQSTFSYIRYIYGSLIELLDDGDEYYSISSMQFWSRDRIFNSELYLNQNLQACKRGVIINRKILIDINRINMEAVHELIKKHETCLGQVGNEIKSRFNLTFMLTKNYQKELKKYRGFGLATHKNGKEKQDCVALITSNAASIDEEPKVDVHITKEGNAHYTKVVLDLLNRFETISNENEEISLEGLKKKIENSTNKREDDMAP